MKFLFNELIFFSSILQQLPVKIYESVIDIVLGEATMLFVNLSYTLATEEAERIGVDHVVRTSTHENGGKSAGKCVILKINGTHFRLQTIFPTQNNLIHFGICSCRTFNGTA